MSDIYGNPCHGNLFHSYLQGPPIKTQRNTEIPSDIKTAAVDKFQAEGSNPLCNWILLVLLLLSSGPSI